MKNLLSGGEYLMAKQNKYTVSWSGKYPTFYLGEWTIKKNNDDVTYFLPTELRTRPAFTYGTYPVWEENPFTLVQQWAEDGYQIAEWIRINLYWLQLMADEDIDYATIYNAFHEKDFRTSRYL